MYSETCTHVEFSCLCGGVGFVLQLCTINIQIINFVGSLTEPYEYTNDCMGSGNLQPLVLPVSRDDCRSEGASSCWAANKILSDRIFTHIFVAFLRSQSVCAFRFSTHEYLEDILWRISASFVWRKIRKKSLGGARLMLHPSRGMAQRWATKTAKPIAKGANTCRT